MAATIQHICQGAPEMDMADNRSQSDSECALSIWEDVAQKFWSFYRVKIKQNVGVLHRDFPENITHVRQCLSKVALDHRPDTPKR